MSDEPEIDWPTTEGIWMGFVGGVGWFPFQTMPLRDDLPTKAEMEAERLNPGSQPPRRILSILARWLKSEKEWPYTFQSCHPCKRWRMPNEDELKRAKVFYGIKA